MSKHRITAAEVEQLFDDMLLDSQEWDAMWNEYIDAKKRGDEARCDEVALYMAVWHDQHGWDWPPFVAKRVRRLQA